MFFALIRPILLLLLVFAISFFIYKHIRRLIVANNVRKELEEAILEIEEILKAANEMENIDYKALKKSTEKINNILEIRRRNGETR